MAILYPTSLDTDNTLYELTNNAKTYLNGALDTSGGNNGQSATIDVVTGSVFPTTAGFFLIGTELFSYSSRTGNKLIGIVRAYGGTTAVAHPSGAIVRMVVMAEFHNILVDAIIQLETKLGAAGSENYCKRFSQAADPAMTSSNNVLDGDVWNDTGAGQVFIRKNGAWATIA